MTARLQRGRRVRFAADGTLDTSFGTGGTVGTDFNTQAADVANAVVVQPDGAIVVAGLVGPVIAWPARPRCWRAAP